MYFIRSSFSRRQKYNIYIYIFYICDQTAKFDIYYIYIYIFKFCSTIMKRFFTFKKKICNLSFLSFDFFKPQIIKRSYIFLRNNNTWKSIYLNFNVKKVSGFAMTTDINSFLSIRSSICCVRVYVKVNVCLLDVERCAENRERIIPSRKET